MLHRCLVKDLKITFSDSVINLSLQRFVQNSSSFNTFHEKWQSVAMCLNKIILTRGTVFSNCKDVEIKRQLYIYASVNACLQIQLIECSYSVTYHLLSLERVYLKKKTVRTEQ